MKYNVYTLSYNSKRRNGKVVKSKLGSFSTATVCTFHIQIKKHVIDKRLQLGTVETLNEDNLKSGQISNQDTVFCPKVY